MANIIVLAGGEEQTCAFQPGETLLEALRRGGWALSAPCGGQGKCGKCRVTLQSGADGRSVLACETPAAEGQRVLWEERGGDICVESGTAAQSGGHAGGAPCGAAVDLGTTTVALRLVELASGGALATAAAWNAQAPYGADVITRAQYAMERPEGLETLRGVACGQIQTLLRQACAGAGIPVETVGEIYVAGNTIMEHLLCGLSPATIAVAPFTPLTLFRRDAGRPLGAATLRCAPCVAGYVGGDITAGLLASGLYEKEGRSLFLDVGTNGEMALGGRDGFLCCAVASGPAFEGAGITCGMTGVEGAVSRVRWVNGAVAYEVIGGGAPRGFCGSGLLDLLALLLQEGGVDETGLLLPPDETPAALRPYITEDEDGNGLFHLSAAPGAPTLAARDVRQLQLAKAAVAAGIAVLLETAALRAEELESVVLAGGFGSRLSPESAIAIGMLPAAARGCITAAGNTALAGAALALRGGEARETLEMLRGQCEYLELSGNAAFNRLYPQCMSFDEEDEPWN